MLKKDNTTESYGLRPLARVLRFAVTTSESETARLLRALNRHKLPFKTVDEVEVHFIIKREKKGGRGR
jgi:hypothetical protein